MRVWTVQYSNYDPAEIDSLWATEAEAQAEADRLNDEPESTGMWTVGTFEVRGAAPDRAAADALDKALGS